MPIYVVEYGRGIVTPLKVDPRIKKVDELQEISALHPLGISDHGQSGHQGQSHHAPLTYETYQLEERRNRASDRGLPAVQPQSLQPAKRFMSSPVLMGKDSWSIKYSLAFLQDHDISHLPVSDGQNVIGLVSECDLLRAMVDNTIATLEQLCGPYIVISGENSLERVALAMLYKNVDGVLVRNSEFKIEGILTTVDFLKVFTQLDLETWA
jgi:predicted transcriptional regulator